MCKKLSFRALTMQHDSTYSVFFSEILKFRSYTKSLDFLWEGLLLNILRSCLPLQWIPYVCTYNFWLSYTCFLFFKSEIRGVEYNDDYPIMLQKLVKKSKDAVICWGREQPYGWWMRLLPKGGSSHGRALFEKQSKEFDPGQTFFFTNY